MPLRPATIGGRRFRASLESTGDRLDLAFGRLGIEAFALMPAAARAGRPTMTRFAQTLQHMATVLGRSDEACEQLGIEERMLPPQVIGRGRRCVDLVKLRVRDGDADQPIERRTRVDLQGELHRRQRHIGTTL